MAATASMSSAASVPASNSGLAGPPSKKTRPMRVPPKVVVGDLNYNNIGTLRKLNSVLFPVSYSDKFYKEVLSPELEDYCKLVFYNDIPVGAICCRIERTETTNNQGSSASANEPVGKLYLMTLGILAPYRRQGLASKLVSHVLSKAKEASLAASLTPAPSATPAPAPNTAPKGKGKASTHASNDTKADAEKTPIALPSPILQSIFVHVQVNNDDAKAFWEKQGFELKSTEKDYYKKNIEGPRDAWLLEKDIDI